jgi:pyroglutamyl-peptidase
VRTRIAVTGFARFGAHAVNPSEEVVRSLAPGAELATLVLPVAYAGAEERLVRWLDALRPRALLLLGRHEGEAIRLERCARNRDDADGPDEAGERRCAPIRPGGPDVHASTLPLDAFAAALAQRGLPFGWSDDAGGFLCNHVFYVARDWMERSGLALRCGFVHLPPPEALALERQREAVVACLDVLRAEPGR